MLVEQRQPTISSVTTLPVHRVNTNTRLFCSPVDFSVPSDNHPVVPIMDTYLISLQLLDSWGRAYPIVSLENCPTAYMSFDGAFVYSAEARDMMLIDGLEGRLALLFRRIKGSVVGDGVGIITFTIPDGTQVLDDTVIFNAVEVPPVPVCNNGNGYSKNGLNVMSGYMEPSNEILGYTFIYMGADGLLLQGHMYKCALVDNQYVWQNETPLWVDDERWIEWGD